jgi:hypothetical protein
MMVNGSPPYGWLITQFPGEVAFVGVRQTFPESAAYRAKLHEIVQVRGGPVYAVIQAYYPSRADTIDRQNAWASALGFESGRRGCDFLHWLQVRAQLRLEVHDTDATGAQCTLAVLPSDQEDTAGEDRAAVATAADSVVRYGFRIDADSCRVYMGHVGQGSYPYQWCRVTEASRKQAAKEKGG